MDWLAGIDNPLLQTLVATGFTWLLTALGAAFVFFFTDVRDRVMDGMLGFAAGVMIAASFWSLLAPAIEYAEGGALPAWVPAAAGFLAGAAFLWAVDQVLPHLHLGLPMSEAEGIHTRWERSILLILAVTIHNIPEGMAIGVAFGSLAAGEPVGTLGGAAALAIGIGIQNMPEGAAISLPLRREGLSRGKSFFWGQASALVEPVGGLAAAALVIAFQPVLPYALAFAAGAMIYVVVEELIPESQQDPASDVGTLGAMLGFAVMMVLDVALG